VWLLLIEKQVPPISLFTSYNDTRADKNKRSSDKIMHHVYCRPISRRQCECLDFSSFNAMFDEHSITIFDHYGDALITSY